MRVIGGAVLSLLLAGLAAVLWDLRAAGAAGAFGILATAIQAAAARLMRGMRNAPTTQFLRRWAAGMGLRLAGVAALAAAALLAPDRVPALPAAMGFLGVLIPLLALELRAGH